MSTVDCIFASVGALLLFSMIVIPFWLFVVKPMEDMQRQSLLDDEEEGTDPDYVGQYNCQACGRDRVFTDIGRKYGPACCLDCGAIVHVHKVKD